MLKGVKKGSDSNLMTPMTPVPTPDDPPKTLDDIDTLIQLTNNLNKAIKQQDMNAFQYVLCCHMIKFYTYY